MTLRSVSLLWVLVVVWACDTEGEVSLQPYEESATGARLPEGWAEKTLESPGFRLLHAWEDPDRPRQSAQLLWLQTTPLTVSVDPESLVAGVRARLELSGVRLSRERHWPGGYEQVVDADVHGMPVRASLFGYEAQGALHVVAFLAPSDQYDGLGGDRLPLQAFNRGRSLAETLGNLGPPPNWPPASTVLAEAGGVQLTQQMVNDAIEYGEFLALRRFNRGEYEFLHGEMISHFIANTAAEFEAHEIIGPFIRRLPTQGAIAQAKLRRDIMAEIHFHIQKSGRVSPLLEVVYRYNPVLAADSKLGVVATRASYTALLESNSYVAAIADLGHIPDKDKDRYLNELEKDYPGYDDRSKQYLADGEVNWITLVAMWSAWNEKSRAKYLRLARVGRTTALNEVPQVARNLESWAGIDVAVRDIRQLNRLQGEIMTLEYLRHAMSTWGP